MSLSAGIERPWAGGTLAEGARLPAVAGTTYNGFVTGQSVQIFDVAAAFVTATTVVNVASILLPRNLPVFQVGVIGTTAGTETGFWVALATQGGIVRAVSANTAAFATGFQNFSVLPANAIPYVTEYAGLYYVAVGTVSTVAPQLAAASPAPTAATNAGPPVYAGTAATAATTTPPALGASLGALTGTVGGIIYGQTA